MAREGADYCMGLSRQLRHAATIGCLQPTATMAAKKAPNYKSLRDTIGATPLVRLQRLPGADNEARGNIILGKLEGNRIDPLPG